MRDASICSARLPSRGLKTEVKERGRAATARGVEKSRARARAPHQFLLELPPSPLFPSNAHHQDRSYFKVASEMARKRTAQQPSAAGEVEQTTEAHAQRREEPVGLLRDHTTSTQQQPWAPAFSVAFRLILLARVASAMWSGIADCDESERGWRGADQVSSSLTHCFLSPAYNYWEPLHLISYPPAPMGTSQMPFQTWEYSPEYAIRSWAYILQYLPLASWLPRLLNMDKVGLK